MPSRVRGRLRSESTALGAQGTIATAANLGFDVAKELRARGAHIMLAAARHAGEHPEQASNG